MLENLTGKEYAPQLKIVLVARKDGNITAKQEYDLGIYANSITQWAIASEVTAGKLYRTQSQDPDFQCDILAEVIKYMDRVDLSREPKEILIYLYRVARHATMDWTPPLWGRPSPAGGRSPSTLCASGCPPATGGAGGPCSSR